MCQAKERIKTSSWLFKNTDGSLVPNCCETCGWRAGWGSPAGMVAEPALNINTLELCRPILDTQR